MTEPKIKFEGVCKRYPKWDRSKSHDLSLHMRAGPSRGTQCSGSECPVT